MLYPLLYGCFICLSNLIGHANLCKVQNHDCCHQKKYYSLHLTPPFGWKMPSRSPLKGEGVERLFGGHPRTPARGQRPLPPKDFNRATLTKSGLLKEFPQP